jgi:hypothetical protein
LNTRQSEYELATVRRFTIGGPVQQITVALVLKRASVSVAAHIARTVPDSTIDSHVRWIRIEWLDLAAANTRTD